MATTKPLIYTGVTIATTADASAASFGESIDDSIEVTLTPVTTRVENGLTVVDAYDVEFAGNFYDGSILADERVNTSGGDAIVKGNITFTGAVGASDLKISDVIINGSRVFDQNRVAARIMGTKRGIDVDVVAVTTAT